MIVTNVLIGIGNSDDKLSQREWSEFIEDMRDLLRRFEVQIHGEWFSRPDSPWQNANWCIEFKPVEQHFGLDKEMQVELRHLAKKYRQDSIAWTAGPVEFLEAR